MKKLITLIFNRWVIGGLGLLALGLIVWYVGPLIALADYRPLETPLARGITIGAVVAFYIGKLLWQALKGRLANARLMDGLVKSAPALDSSGSSDGQQEVATLRQRFEEAVQVLKEVKGKQSKWGNLAGLGRRQYLYELPWYIFIGAPGSGKTTALINSGLQFPLAQRFGQEAIHGVGGTRNCDWWFTDQAVLLDTAGRYTTQESNQKTDSAAWGGFLQLLKKFRPRRPINGVILTLSVADLLQQNAAQMETHAKALRQRIQELHTELNIRFPLYVLITKADLLAGFMEFFNEFGREERAQVWGTTLPITEPGVDPLAGFAAEYAALEQRLNDRLIDRLQQEHDPQRRAALYAFPQQFSALRESLISMLGKVLSPSRYEVAPMLRGVYFTSGTQEGSPIDRVLGGLGRALRLDHKILPPQHGSGKSFFLTRLIQDVIFPEAGLAGTNLRWERQRALLEWASLAAAALFTIGAIAAWTVSYTRNQAYVAAVDKKLHTVNEDVHVVQARAKSNIVELLPTLQALHDLAASPGVPPGETPFTMGFGLYQGVKLEAAADSAYRHFLQDAFLTRLAMQIEEQLYTRGQDNPELLYEGLKAYLMLSDPTHFDAAALKAFVTADWQVSLPRDVTLEQRQALERHLDALLGMHWVSSPIVPDTELIERARASLARTPLAQRIYNRLKHQGVGEDLPEFTIAKAAGPSAALVFARASGQPLTAGVPGLFSFKGYHQAFVQASEQVTKQLAQEEGWVLGLAPKEQRMPPKEQAHLLEEVRRLYLEDYARTWESFINDIILIRVGNLQQSIQVAGILSAADSPLPLLLRAIAHEVTLKQVDEADKTTADKAVDKVQAARAGLMKLFGQPDTQVSTASAMAGPEQVVDARFESLRRLVRSPAPGQPAPIDATLGVVNELYTLLLATDTAVKGGNPPPVSDVPTKLKAEALRMPEPIRSMLTTLSQGGARQALGATRANLSQAIGTEIGEFCNRAIVGRYPFVKSSSEDVTQQDFARLFAPGGLLDNFFNKQLAPYVDTSTRQWRFKQVGEASMGDASGSLIQFQRAQAIREVFFQPGSTTPVLKLEFKPIEMDPSITQFLLDVDGQPVRYSHGPQVPMSVQWPGPRGSTQVRLQISPSTAGDVSGQVYEGPWALFRMLDHAQIESTSQAEQFLVTFNINGRKAQFQVTTSSVQNPFRMHELAQFRCPGRL
ncbi:MAG: type VI secretion system membrane subunit TssM [Gammaproteobacteria bacterium]